jgi:hypothetical protein
MALIPEIFNIVQNSNQTGSDCQELEAFGFLQKNSFIQIQS